MNGKLVTLIAIIAFSPMMAPAQGRGGGGGQGGPRGGQGGGQSQTQRGPGAGQGTLDRDRIRQQLQTHATDQQRDQLRDCTQKMDRLKTQSRDMLNATSGTAFKAEKAIQLRNRVQEEFQAMQQSHQQFMNSLDKEQRQAMQSRTRNMEQIQSRISTRLETMNKELQNSNPNRKQLEEQARYVEREAQRLQNQYRDMGEDLSLSHNE